MMKRKISMALAGLGLCASMMMFSAQEVQATDWCSDKGMTYLGRFWCPVDGGEDDCSYPCASCNTTDVCIE